MSLSFDKNLQTLNGKVNWNYCLARPQFSSFVDKESFWKGGRHRGGVFEPLDLMIERIYG